MKSFKQQKKFPIFRYRPNFALFNTFTSVDPVMLRAHVEWLCSNGLPPGHH